MKLGVHCSIRHGYKNALYEAKQLHCDTFQMFTHSPRVWKFKLPSEQEILEFVYEREKLGIKPLIIHVAYLPNPASSDKKVYEQSKTLLLTEFFLAEKCNADYIIIHPGSYSSGATLQEGISLVVKSIDYCFEQLFNFNPNTKLMLLLENVCSKTRKIGKNFFELARIIELSKFSENIGVCIDTAHIHSSGYDLSREYGLERMLMDLKYYIGIEKLKVVHLNDTKTVSGSCIDRHEHIGKGYIGIEGFRRIVNHPVISKLPGILETPKETSFGKISQKDKQNLSIIKNLLK